MENVLTCRVRKDVKGDLPDQHRIWDLGSGLLVFAVSCVKPGAGPPLLRDHVLPIAQDC